MFGKNSHLNSLASRKQLLIAESELNRAQMVGDIAELMTGAGTLAERVKSLGSISGLLAAGMAAFRGGGPPRTEAKPSWLQTLLKGAGVASSLWMAFRSKRGGQDDR